MNMAGKQLNKLMVYTAILVAFKTYHTDLYRVKKIFKIYKVENFNLRPIKKSINKLQNFIHECLDEYARSGRTVVTPGGRGERE